MRRRLFTLLSALSLLLCVGTCAMWVRSYRIEDAVVWPGKGGKSSDWAMLAVSEKGGLGFAVAPDLTPNFWAAEWTRELAAQYAGGGWRNDSFWNHLGFGYMFITFPVNGRLHIVAIPWWLPVTITLLPPAAWVTLLMRRRRRKHSGLCPVCGYDLRATPDRCPECGTVPSAGK